LIVAGSSDYLLVDVSNSYAKFAFASTTRVFAPTRIVTDKVSTRMVAQLLEKRNVGKVVVSSVVPAKNSAILKAAGKAKVIWLDWKLKLGVEIDYPKPRSIGADRLANAAAVTVLYGCPAVVVDFGTAVTFDIVSERQAYIGGVIAPGLEAMTNFLYQRAALLPKLSLKEPQRAPQPPRLRRTIFEHARSHRDDRSLPDRSCQGKLHVASPKIRRGIGK
jgi:type III pantothenate kinase